MRRRLVLAALLLVVCACEKESSPSPPNAGVASQVQTITGRERIGWDQQIPTASDAARYRYAIYLDGVRSEVADVSCGPPVGGTLMCTGRLPVMSAGAHTLELATFIQNGAESARSVPLRVMVQGALAQQTESLAWSSGPADANGESTSWIVDRVADGLHDPVDLAAAPDGRVFVAERAGRVRIVSPDGRSTSADAAMDEGELLAIALDGQFPRTHLVYALYAAPAAGGPTYRIARYREIAGTLGERAVLLNAIAPAARPASGSLRVLPDGHLLVAVSALPDGDEGGGMLLRFARDGTTPRDQDRPTVATGLATPHAAWDAARGVVWVIDGSGTRYRLSQLPIPSHRSSQAPLTAGLPVPGNAITVCDNELLPTLANDLLMASPQPDGLVRVRVQEREGSLSLTTEPLLRRQVGPVLAVTVAAKGAIYFATSDALGRLVPGQSSR